MHIYTIGYTLPDGGKRFELTHDANLSQEQLNGIVFGLLPEAARLHVLHQADKERKRAELPEELFQEQFIPRVRFPDLLPIVIDLLIERHGFKKIVYTGRFEVFAVPDLLVRGDAAGDPDGNDELQGQINDVLAAGGLPVVTQEERDAHEDRKIAIMTPIRRQRRAARSLPRMLNSGHNGFKTEDVELVVAILKELAEREVREEEYRALVALLPPVLETTPHPFFIMQAMRPHAELEELLVVMEARLPPELQKRPRLPILPAPEPEPEAEPAKAAAAKPKAKAPAKPRAKATSKAASKTAPKSGAQKAAAPKATAAKKPAAPRKPKSPTKPVA